MCKLRNAMTDYVTPSTQWQTAAY